MKDAKVRQDIYNFIKTHGVMTLATSDNKSPWVCTVYYGLDNKMNLYIVTDPRSIHGKQIEKNDNVAFNIFDSHQKITKPKRGVQGKGKIKMVKNITEITKALYLWHKANPGIEKNITVKDVLKKLTDTKIYKITPTYMKFFNKVLYPETEYGEAKL